MDDSVTEMPGGWHLDKKVSIGHIVTTIVVAASAFFYLSTLDKRISDNTAAISFNTERIRASEQRTQDDMRDIKGALIRIESKLDQKADK